MKRVASEHWPTLALLALGGLLLGTAPCGAENVDAPPESDPVASGCLAPQALAPAFYAMLEQDAFAGLRQVIEASLSVCTVQGQPASCGDPRAETPAMGVLLARLFSTLLTFASDPPEAIPGTKPGDPGYCVATDAEAITPNRLCIIRRALDRLIQARSPDGRLVLQQAFIDLKPLLADVFRYIDGGFPSVSAPRYSDFSVLRSITRRCGGDDFVGVIDAFLTWFNPPHAAEALDALLTLLRNPDATRFLDELDIQNDVGRGGFVALGRMLLDTIRSDAFDPVKVQKLLEDLLYPFVASTYPDNDLEGDLRRVVGVAMDLLDPGAQPSMVTPLAALLDCHVVADPDDLLLDMVYDLSIAANAIHIDKLVETLRALLDLDPEGSLTRAMHELFSELEADEALRDALTRTMNILLQEENARLLVPIMVSVLDSEVPSEAVAILDAMLGGCQDRARTP